MFLRILVVLLIASSSLFAETPPSAVKYVSEIRLPVPLWTGKGAALDETEYDLELRAEGEQYCLAFVAKKEDRGVVCSSPGNEQSAEAGPTVPLVGTTFLRATADPLPPEVDRQYSKTGRAIYEEWNRDWKATLRAFRFPAPGDPEVRFVLSERGKDRSWRHTEFTLFLRKVANE